MYFSLTTLSTIGFGDIHPRSDVEKLFSLPLFMFGCAIWANIMSNFLNMLEDIIKYRSSLEDSDHLYQFLGVIKKLNRNKKDIKLKK